MPTSIKRKYEKHRIVKKVCKDFLDMRIFQFYQYSSGFTEFYDFLFAVLKTLDYVVFKRRNIDESDIAPANLEETVFLHGN